MQSALLAASSLMFAAAAYAAFGEGRRDRAVRIRAGAAGESRASRAIFAAGIRDCVDGVVVEPKPGRVAQIDHVAKAAGWLVVVETKNWSGVVWGDARDVEWTVTKPSGETRKQRNPIFQAQRQARLLGQATGAPATSVVLMVGSARHASGAFPPGVLTLAGAAEGLSRVTREPPRGVRPNAEAAARGFAAVERLSADPDAGARANRHADAAEARYGHHKWLAWLTMSVATASAAWAMDPEPVLKALFGI